jgi:hypothetical protein
MCKHVGRVLFMTCLKRELWVAFETLRNVNRSGSRNLGLQDSYSSAQYGYMENLRDSVRPTMIYWTSLNGTMFRAQAKTRIRLWRSTDLSLHPSYATPLWAVTYSISYPALKSIICIAHLPHEFSRQAVLSVFSIAATARRSVAR